MKIVEKKDNKLVFRAEMSESLANSIRRYTFEVPVVAIDEAEISKNDSALYDETIAHRLGLIPLVMPKAVAKSREFNIKLNSKKEGFVFSEELIGDLKPAFNKIPITALDNGQEISLKATARLGKGKEHSKFTPGLMIYRDIVYIKTEKNCPKEVTEVCPKNLIVEDNGKIKVTDSLACDACGICVDTATKHDKDCIKIEPTNELLITIESFGQISPEDVFIKSIEELKSDLVEVSKKI